jgi:hypothetical protein
VCSAFSEFKVHYENNTPFPMAKVAIREIEVGPIAFLSRTSKDFH